MQLTKSSTQVTQGPHQGCHVQLQGLLARADLNGCFGYVCGVFDSASQRWPVRVTLPAGDTKDMLLKAGNLVCTQPVMARDCYGGLRASLQEAAVIALGSLVYNHHANQSAAAEAGAVPLLVQLTKSSNAALQQAAVNTLARFEQGPTEPPSAAA
jgi:hypothetical protein